MSVRKLLLLDFSVCRKRLTGRECMEGVGILQDKGQNSGKALRWSPREKFGAYMSVSAVAATGNLSKSGRLPYAPARSQRVTKCEAEQFQVPHHDISITVPSRHFIRTAPLLAKSHFDSFCLMQIPCDHFASGRAGSVSRSTAPSAFSQPARQKQRASERQAAVAFLRA